MSTGVVFYVFIVMGIKCEVSHGGIRRDIECLKGRKMNGRHGDPYLTMNLDLTYNNRE